MLHLGDITKINGYTAPIVDVVVGGSPCQDLSVAGKRAGLDGERSGLFMEQLRIIKEMRERDRRNGRSDEHIRPRYMVWENVPGAFSSNKAEDFRIVLEETAKVIDKDAVIPLPEKGKWTTSGCIMGDGWSIAWRVCDAQFYGVPQRRRRIALVADFGGQSAPEILFVRKSVSRDTQPSQSQGKETPTDAPRCIGADDSQCFCFEPGAAKRLGGYVWEGLAPTLRTEVGDNRPSVAYTMQDREGKAGGGKGALIAEELSATLRAGFAQTLFQPVQCIDQGGGKSACNVQEGQAPTLTCTHGGEPAVCYSIENHPADSRVDIDESGKVQTLTSRMGTGGGNVPMVMHEANGFFSKQAIGEYKESNVAHCLNARDYKEPTDLVAYVDQNYIDVEMEVAVRKHPIDCKLLCECLRDHKTASNFSNKDIAEALDVPLTKVEHWFRQDECFAIPDADVWFDLKKLLGITTDEFDESITTFEYKGGNYDMRNRIYTSETAPTLACGCGNSLYMLPKVNPPIGLGIQSSAGIGAMAENIMPTLINGDNPGWQNGVLHSVNGNSEVRVKYIVRRLTPLECERLQGYPDGWTDIGEWVDSKGKVHKTSDAARYKALGNSIALPPWKWVLKRLCACYERDATMASLFDGIGGFPLIWEQINGKGTCLWASEIEEFPMAVTKKRIGG